jgi:hypothetical protein
VKRVAATILGVACVAAAAFLVVLAADVRKWDSQLTADDARFRAYPASEDLWQTSTILPEPFSRTLLETGDDVRYRRAANAFFFARPHRRGHQLPELDAARAEAQLVLARLFAEESNPNRRADVGNFYGALSLAVLQHQDVEQRVSTLEAAVATLQESLRTDPSNEEAKYNLESAMRRLRAQPPPFESSPGGRRPREDENVAGLRDPGGGY